MVALDGTRGGSFSKKSWEEAGKSYQGAKRTGGVGEACPRRAPLLHRRSPMNWELPQASSAPNATNATLTGRRRSVSVNKIRAVPDD